MAVLGAAVAVLAGSLAAAPTASAHAQLVNSAPGDGADVAVVPAQLRVRLSESVVAASSLMVLTDGSGRVVPLTGLHVESSTSAADTGNGAGLITRPGDVRVPATLVAQLPTLPPDVYHLAWQQCG